MTLIALANATGVPYRSLQAYLLARHALPADVAIRIAEALNVDVGWLLTGASPPLDASLVRRSLELLEGVRQASAGKLSLGECAMIFAGFYSKLAKEQQPAPEPPGSDRIVLSGELKPKAEPSAG
jgi:hypothetical protein